MVGDGDEWVTWNVMLVIQWVMMDESLHNRNVIECC